MVNGRTSGSGKRTMDGQLEDKRDRVPEAISRPALVAVMVGDGSGKTSGNRGERSRAVRVNGAGPLGICGSPKRNETC
jgi:hypothetical protein